MHAGPKKKQSAVIPAKRIERIVMTDSMADCGRFVSASATKVVCAPARLHKIRTWESSQTRMNI